MARGVKLHGGGAYDNSAQQDLVDGDPFQGPITLLSGTADAINPHVAGNYIITTGSADAITLGAPTAGVDDGLAINIVSSTLFAHTLTSTGNLQTGATGTGVLTMAAFGGCTIALRAYNGKWQVVGLNGVTVTS